MIIKTERLTLRPLCMDDAEILYASHSDAEAMIY